MSRSACILSLLGGLALLLLTPDVAQAWGPGAHLVLSNWLIQNVSLLPAAVAGPIMQFPGQFVHGALSPDIFIGKGSVAVEGHSHNWQTGLALLTRGRAPRWLAYAYGYLSHLAADTVSHNVFVPFALESAPGKGRLAHVYLEAQADRLLSWKTEQALQAFNQEGSLRAATILRDVIQRNKAFWIRRTVFKGSIAVCELPVWQGSLAFMDRLFAPDDLSLFLDKNLHYSLRAVLSSLREPESGPLLALDPIGTEALAAAMVHKRALPASRKVFNRSSPPAPAALLQHPMPDILAALPGEGVPSSLLHA